MAFEREMELAKLLAQEAGAMALDYQRRGVTAEAKADESPVTAADRACEKLIVDGILREFPDDGILGEEGANREGGSGRRWIIDPIDGTRDFVRGNPLWANLIGLEADGEVVAGVVHLPMLGFLYSAGRGGGAYRNDSPIHVSSRSAIEESVLCINAFSKLAGVKFRDDLMDWMARFWSVRGLGGAADAMMVASGQAEVWITPRASPGDFAPLTVIV